MLMRPSVCRHPFPPHWRASSFGNYSRVELTSGTEFAQVRRQFNASLPRATMELLSVTRYVLVHTLAPAICHARCTVVSYVIAHLVLHGTGFRIGSSGSVTNGGVT